LIQLCSLYRSKFVALTIFILCPAFPVTGGPRSQRDWWSLLYRNPTP
jgi:hypothetical protein